MSLGSQVSSTILSLDQDWDRIAILAAPGLLAARVSMEGPEAAI